MSDLSHAVHEGSFTIAGVIVRTYVLSDGRRIMDADDVAALFEAMGAGASPTIEEAEAFARWRAGR